LPAACSAVVTEPALAAIDADHTLTFSQYRQVAWRNGGGTARDIAVQPADAGMGDPFGWRVALAEIEKDGQFSVYEPAVERIITLLDGDGFDLDFAEAPGQSLGEPHMPARFRGQWQTRCQLKGGRCVVFNILYDDEKFTAQTHIVRPPADQPLIFSPPGRQTILFCLAGQIEIKADEQQKQAMPERLAPWDSLRIDLGAGEAPLLSLVARATDSRLLLVGFDPLPMDDAGNIDLAGSNRAVLAAGA
jgi:environmental stress-induced protein Ves